MSKAVLISIRPTWCGAIASGRKTIEVRKTRPKLDTPFKCYIYCTKAGSQIYAGGEKANGKVVGEFVCDKIMSLRIEYSAPQSPVADNEFPCTCLTDRQVMDYLGNGGYGYGWHISDLVIYDKPKELREFSKYWDYFIDNQTPRPPQSWCYVEELC